MLVAFPEASLHAQQAAPLFSVPDVTGRRLDAARKIIGAAGFRIGREIKLPSGLAGAEDSVVRQAPTPPQRLTRGSSINLWVTAPAAPTQPSTMPNVVGRSLDEARRILLADTIRVARTVDIQDSNAAPGTVVRQAPLAGARVSRDRTAILGVAPGVAVPSLRDRTLADADALLRSVGLRLGDTTYRPSTTVDAGVVLDQRPAANELVKPQTLVRVLVSQAVPRMPVLTDRPLADALRIIEQTRLRLDRIDSTDSRSTPGVVVRQLPVANTPIQPAAPVRLTVARTPPFAMPRLIDLTVADARTLLNSQGLLVGSIQRADAEGRVDTVVTQTPLPGVRVRRGDTANIVVGRAVSTVLVPSVIGLSSAEARDSLQRVGLTLSSLGSRESDSRTGRVVAQRPEIGQTVRLGSGVELDTAVSQLVLVPNFVGRHVREALALRSNDSLRVTTRYTTAGAGFADSSVTQQSLDSGARVPVGTAVELTVFHVPLIVTQPSLAPTPAPTFAPSPAPSPAQPVTSATTAESPRGQPTTTPVGAAPTGVTTAAAPPSSTVTPAPPPTEPVILDAPDSNGRSHWRLAVLAALAIAAAAGAAWKIVQTPPPPLFQYKPGAENEQFAVAIGADARGTRVALSMHADPGIQAVAPTGVRLLRQEDSHG